MSSISPKKVYDKKSVAIVGSIRALRTLACDSLHSHTKLGVVGYLDA